MQASLFDFDNTLQEGDKLELHARLSEIVRRLSMNITEAEVVSIGNSTPDYREMRSALVKLANSRDGGRFTEDEFTATNNVVSGMFDDKFYLADGAKEALEYQRAEGIPTGLVTTRGGNSLPRLLERHGIAQYFDVVINRESCQERKPNPRPLLLALEKLGIEPAYAMYTGDSQKDDVGAAKNAGVLSVLKSTEQPVAGNGLPQPDYWISSLRALPLIVKQLG